VIVSAITRSEANKSRCARGSVLDSFGGDAATVAHRYDVLRQHCERVGRPFEAITRSNDASILIAFSERELAAKKERYGDTFHLMGTPDQIIEGMRQYAQAGSQYLTFNMPDARDIEPILLLGETVVRC